jgi:nucleoside-diphosphate-sugar epimerase
LALGGRPLTIYGDGKQTRDFTYVTETADYLVRLALSPHTAGSTYNVCRGEEVSILDIAKIIVSITGSRSEIHHLPARPNDVLRLYGDPGRLRSVLGDSPSISIDAGLRRTIEWFKENVPLTDTLFASFSAREWEALTPEPWIAAVQSRNKKSKS